VPYTAEETAFAQTLQKSFDFAAPAIASAAQVRPLKDTGSAGGGSTDVGDVSWNVPTVGLYAATWVPGTAAHSWQAAACGGTEIGTKGMLVAAKTLALTAIDLFSDATLVQKAKAELAAARTAGFVYKPLLGDRVPALNYRD
jgi:aminobenzoyl-glutamate utilization protein B